MAEFSATFAQGSANFTMDKGDFVLFERLKKNRLSSQPMDAQADFALIL